MDRTRSTDAPPARRADHGRAGPDAPAGCSAEVREPGRVVALAGRLDVRATSDVRLLLAAQVRRGSGELVLDVSGLQGLDATGLGLLVDAHRSAGRHGRVLVLRDSSPALARLLVRTRLDRVLRQVRSCA